MESVQSSILFWNRQKGQVEVEQIYGDFALKAVYETRPGQILANQVLARPFLSRIYGNYQSSRWSARKIAPFIHSFQIPMEEFEDGPFRSFNEFFIRKFKPGYRDFVQEPGVLPAFAEARYFAYEKILSSQEFVIKGVSLSLSKLLGSREKAKPFEGGPALIARLCPTDYHRFHFPDEGRILENYTVSGKLHSVNPIALKYKPEILVTNERHISLLETKNFGILAYVEVGALCVGKIVQTHPKKKPFYRGSEKGFFLFGGSTVVVLGQPGVWKPDLDLLEQTQEGREALVRLGESVGSLMPRS